MSFRALAEHLAPRRLQRTRRLVRTLRASGVTESPGTLFRFFRHRQQLRRLSRVFFDFRYGMALLMSHEVGLLSACAQRQLTPEELASAVGIHPRAAEALLLILESADLVERRDDRFGLTEFSAKYLVPGSADSIAPMLGLLAGNAGAFSDAVTGLRTGATPRALDIFTPDGRYRDFIDAVNGYLLPATRDFVERVALPDVRDFIVGSMGVSFSSVILERFPSSRVTYGCLEHLVREIPRLRDLYAVPEHRVIGTHVHGGDPSADRWGEEAFDLVFLTKKMILAPEESVGEKFAKKALDVLRPGGVAIFWECVHPDHRPTPMGRAMEAALDLAASPHGPVFTEQRIAQLLTRIGFARVEVVPLLMGELTFVVAWRA